MVKSSNNQHKVQQKRKLAKLGGNQVEIIEEWINQKNEWDILKKELKINSKSKTS